MISSPACRTVVKAAAILIAVGLSGCERAGAGISAGDDPDLGLLNVVMQQVRASYVKKVTQRELVTDALRGMLSRLDPHSDYMDERQYKEMVSVTRGRFGGIGIELTLEGGVPQIISPIDGTPAASAGIEPGDRIVKVDGTPTAGMESEEVVKRLRGAVGTKVKLTILRRGRPPFDVVLTRAIVRVVSVKSKIQPGKIGYARITTFVENTPGEFAEAVRRMEHQAGGRLSGFILDLRNDPGGLLDAAVDVSGDFLDGGTVVTTRGRDSEDDHVYTAPVAGDLLHGAPVVVLINSASASAAEIVAGALKDNHRATVMGTRSFGKGSVQSIIPLDGEGALRLTTALYYTPSGQSIQDRGIEPDVLVQLPKDEAVANTIIGHESDLYGAFKNAGPLGGRGAPLPEAPARAEEHPINPMLIGTARDSQFESALRYLQRRGHQANAARRG
ncbi:MAG TPA: S41 family peptidase [Stellaceae bacterium]|nr:S41 family peptidase [Stellaceae bacterium]